MDKMKLLSLLLSLIIFGVSLYGFLLDHRRTIPVYSANYTNQQNYVIDKSYVTSGPLNYACDYENDKAAYGIIFNISCNIPYIIINPINAICNYDSYGMENNITYTALCNTSYRLCLNNEHVIVLFNNTNYNDMQNNILSITMSSFTIHYVNNTIPSLNMALILPISMSILIVICITTFFPPSRNNYRNLKNKRKIISVSNTTESTNSSESTVSTV